MGRPTKKKEKLAPGPKPRKKPEPPPLRAKKIRGNSDRAERENFNRLVHALGQTQFGFAAAGDAVEQTARLATQVDRLRAKIAAMTVDGPDDLGLPDEPPDCLRTTGEQSAYGRVLALLRARPPLTKPQMETVIVACRRLARLDALQARFLGDPSDESETD
jgi:hypothetical protein